MTVTRALKPGDLAAIGIVRRAAKNGVTKKVREAANLSQPELGLGCGVSHVSILRWERGDRSPNGMGAVRYAAIIRALVSSIETDDAEILELRAALAATESTPVAA
jgi:transcriptional regulator with XRE-family HTH domain